MGGVLSKRSHSEVALASGDIQQPKKGRKLEESAATPMKRANHSSSSHQDNNKKPPGKKKTIANNSNTLILPESVLFQKVAGFLHWKDCMNLGELNKDYRQSYLPFMDTILRPLLEKLESLCKSNVHDYCRKVSAPASKRVCKCGPEERQNPLASLDPRYENDAYDSLSIDVKCARMIDFLATLVSNMRPHLNFAAASIADPSRMPDAIGTIQGNWSLGMGHEGNAVLAMYPLRTALAFNLALAEFAQGAMESGHDSYFNQAFLGDGPIDPCGSCFGSSMCYLVEEMLPLNDIYFLRFLHTRVLPSADTRKLLGPALSSRVILCAPFLEWIDENGRLVLPEGLEDVDGTAVERAMAEWDARDDGRGDGWFEYVRERAL